jgi:protein involved in temperature-dependent protein secretion
MSVTRRSALQSIVTVLILAGCTSRSDPAGDKEGETKTTARSRETTPEQTTRTTKSKTAETQEETTTAETYRNELIVENFRSEAISVRLAITPAGDDVAAFSEEFELAQGNTMHAQKIYPDVAALDGEAVVRVEVNGGPSKSYDWTPDSDDYDRELTIDVTDDGIEFSRE